MGYSQKYGFGYSTASELFHPVQCSQLIMQLIGSSMGEFR